MADQEPSPGKNYSDIWRAIAGTLAGIVLALAACIWNMDKDRATKADLAPISANVVSLQVQVSTLSEQVGELKGELKGRKELGP